MRAAIDGEPLQLDSPLELESLPRALRVLLPGTSVDDNPVDEGGAMHDNPRATEDEQEQAQGGRQQEEEAMRGMKHDDPDAQREKTRGGDESE